LRIEVQQLRDGLHASEAQCEALKRRDVQIEAVRDEWETSHDRMRREIQQLKRALEEVSTFDCHVLFICIVLNHVTVLSCIYVHMHAFAMLYSKLQHTYVFLHGGTAE
jgi:hypothetical protein